LNADDGKEIWKYEFSCKFDKRMFDGGTASTPTIDGQYVYNLSFDGQAQCLKLADGKPVWTKNVIREFGGKQSRWKYAGSPLVLGKLVIFDIGGSPNSTLALDKRTGKRVWGKGSETTGYATPIPFKQGTTVGVMVFKGKTIVAHAAKDGRELWRIPFPTKYDVNASTPIVFGKTFFASAGYDTGRGVLYEITSSTPKQLWRNNEFKTKMSSAVANNGYVYGISLKGGLMCLDMKTGKTLWTDGSSGKEGTLTLADGKLIILSDRGELIIAEANPAGFKPIARKSVLNGRCWVVPVIANGRIYCKTNQGQMVCLDVR
jgi:outer membrane protein assembly factor BamB